MKMPVQDDENVWSPSYYKKLTEDEVKSIAFGWQGRIHVNRSTEHFFNHFVDIDGDCKTKTINKKKKMHMRLRKARIWIFTN